MCLSIYLCVYLPIYKYIYLFIYFYIYICLAIFNSIYKYNFDYFFLSIYLLISNPINCFPQILQIAKKKSISPSFLLTYLSIYIFSADFWKNYDLFINTPFLPRYTIHNSTYRSNWAGGRGLGRCSITHPLPTPNWDLCMVKKRDLIVNFFNFQICEYSYCSNPIQTGRKILVLGFTKCGIYSRSIVRCRKSK